MCQEKEEEGFPILKTELTHRYNYLKPTKKSVEENWVQLPEKKYWEHEEHKNGNNNKKNEE